MGHKGHRRGPGKEVVMMAVNEREVDKGVVAAAVVVANMVAGEASGGVETKAGGVT